MTYILEFPAKISPPLPGGRVHTIRVDGKGLEIGTLVGYYGNKENKTVVSIAHNKLKVVVLTPHRFWRYERCRIVYLDDQNEERVIEFAVVDSDVSGLEPFTRYVAQALGRLKDGARSESIEPMKLEFPIIRPITKLIFGTGLFMILLIALALKSGAAGFVFLTSLLLCIGLVAVAIDSIRLHTNWHPLLKFVAAISTFALGFALCLAIVFSLEALGVIR
ncbi:MAG: hypothetical protein ABI847_18980 [Anaerolineales bacterium]